MSADNEGAPSHSSLFWFVILAFAPTWILWAMLARFHVTPAEKGRFALFGTAGMYFPGIAALILCAINSDWRDITLGRLGSPRFYIWAWLLFPALILATAVLDLIFGMARPDWSLGQLPSALRNTEFVVGQLATAIAIGPLAHGLTTIGEELGWRDFLLPRLIRLGAGQWTALIATGVIWGVWHVPVILFGFEYAAPATLSIPMFVGYAVLVGVILGWMRLASGSVWVSALAHGSINAVQRALLIFVTGYDTVTGGPLGSLMGWIVLCVCIVWLTWSERLPTTATHTPGISLRLV